MEKADFYAFSLRTQKDQLSYVQGQYCEYSEKSDRKKGCFEK